MLKADAHLWVETKSAVWSRSRPSRTAWSVSLLERHDGERAIFKHLALGKKKCKIFT